MFLAMTLLHLKVQILNIMEREELLNRIKELKKRGVTVDLKFKQYTISGSASAKSYIPTGPKNPADMILSITYSDGIETIRDKVIRLEEKIKEFDEFDNSLFEYLRNGLSDDSTKN